MDSDQTGRMPRLIWVVAGRTCDFVGFVMRWLIHCAMNDICISISALFVVVAIKKKKHPKFIFNLFQYQIWSRLKNRVYPRILMLNFGIKLVRIYWNMSDITLDRLHFSKVIWNTRNDLSWGMREQTRWHVCPAKTQISLGISSLSARRNFSCP